MYLHEEMTLHVYMCVCMFLCMCVCVCVCVGGGVWVCACGCAAPPDEALRRDTGVVECREGVLHSCFTISTESRNKNGSNVVLCGLQIICRVTRQAAHFSPLLWSVFVCLCVCVCVVVCVLWCCLCVCVCLYCSVDPMARLPTFISAVLCATLASLW